MRVLVTTLLAGLTLTACATRPQVAHEGDLTGLKGQVVVAEAGPAAPTGADAALAKAIEARVASQVGAGVGASARYRLQVAVATSPAQVGASTGVGPQVGVAPWRSAPTKLHFWNRHGPVRTASLAVLDLSTGKVTAWASVRSSSTDAADLADRLLAALGPARG
jgi:transposase InsO family protein